MVLYIVAIEKTESFYLEKKTKDAPSSIGHTCRVDHINLFVVYDGRLSGPTDGSDLECYHFRSMCG